VVLYGLKIDIDIMLLKRFRHYARAADMAIPGTLNSIKNFHIGLHSSTAELSRLKNTDTLRLLLHERLKHEQLKHEQP
jgi:hypothetical protein